MFNSSNYDYEALVTWFHPLKTISKYYFGNLAIYYKFVIFDGGSDLFIYYKFVIFYERMRVLVKW